ncbi:MAG: efflux RND transporter periplasmic adaptor subunit, partial [Maritimibacter sp.]|nr:efflux RND transporter periplasmic adaptor subunit [Maritimibacter sp.]
PRAEENRLVGRIEAARSYAGAFRAGGRIVEIAVDAGDRVPAGTVIARIDATQAEAAQSGARAELAAADAALRQAEQARDRAKDLLDRGVGTRAQLDTAEEAWLAARAQRDQAEAQLDSADQAVEDTVMRTTEEVVILDRLAEPGAIVGAGETVLTLATAGRLEALFLSPDFAGLAALRGLAAELKPDGLPPIATEITDISPVLTATGTVEVRAEIPPRAAVTLVIGDIIEGTVRRALPPAFTVPWTALTATSTGPAVWTVDPDTMAVHLTGITVDSYGDYSVDVATGLTEGMLVVGAGSQMLYEGMIVRAAGEQR